MRLAYTERFLKSFEAAPLRVQRAFHKQADFLLTSHKHPSLHAKKYDEALDLWQARVNRDWRFYFVIKDDMYHLIDITRHP